MPGVIFNSPPEELKPSLKNSIASAIALLEPGKKGALVSLVNENGANAAIVVRVNNAWEVQAWIGKDWHKGGTQYGSSVKVSW